MAAAAETPAAWAAGSAALADLEVAQKVLVAVTEGLAATVEVEEVVTEAVMEVAENCLLQPGETRHRARAARICRHGRCAWGASPFRRWQSTRRGAWRPVHTREFSGAYRMVSHGILVPP